MTNISISPTKELDLSKQYDFKQGELTMDIVKEFLALINCEEYEIEYTSTNFSVSTWSAKSRNRYSINIKGIYNITLMENVGIGFWANGYVFYIFTESPYCSIQTF